MFFSQIRRAKTEIVSADARQDAIAAGKSIDYVKLEERRVLNATFAFDLMAAELTLENFTDSDAGLNNVALSQSGNNFVFTLGDGIWSEGGSVAGLDFTLSDGNRVLTINDAPTSLSSILFNDNTADTFDISLGNLDFTIGSVTVTGNDGTFGQISESANLSSGISIGNLSFACTSIDLSNATNDFGVVSGTATGDISLGDANHLRIPFLQTDNGTIAVAAAGQIDIDNSGAAGPAGLTVLDSADLDDPTSAITVVSLNGDVNVLDAIQNNSGGEVFVVAAGTNSDVLVSDQIVTENGAVQISAADQIRFTAESAIDAGGDSNVLISANLNGDGSGDDLGAVRMSDGSLIDAGTGTITITNSGSDGGDVLLSEIRTANSSDLAVSITSAGGIFDATAGESANIFASGGGLRLTAIGDIGAEGDADIDTQVAKLAFATQGRITLTDSADGLVIAGLGALDSSLADGGAQITSHGLLAIRSDVRVGGNTEFTVTASANADDDILIGNLSVIRLDSATQATITLSAGDDIMFDTGSVFTVGHDAHQVNLIADTEIMMDGDVGSVTNTAGIAGVTIQTGRLVISSGDGIGDSSELPSNAPLRVNVDSIAASNSTNNGIRIAESDAIAVESLFNSGRLVELVAGSNILDGDEVPDGLDIDGGVVLITSTNGSVGSDTTDIFKGVFDPLEIRATLSLDMNAPAGLIVVDQLDEVAVATLDASSVVFYSDGDLDAIAGLSAVSLAADSLAFIADGDNDGLGTLTLPQSLSVAGDLRIEGHVVLALDPMSNPVVAELTASRLLFSSDTTVRVDANVQQLDLEIDFAVDPAAQTAGQAVQITNSRSVQLVDLNCDGQSMIATDDDIKIVVADDVQFQAAATLGDGALFIMANGNLSQLEQGIIAAAGLALAVDGQSLANAANDIDVLAADAGDLIVLHDVDDLQVGAVTFGEGTALEMTLSGIAALNDVRLSATDGLHFSAAASVDGNLFLETLGPVSQSTDGTIVSQGLALLVGGPTLLDADNDITTLAASTDSQFVFHDVSDVVIDSVTVASGTAFEMTVNGLSAIDQQAKLIAGGNLVINAPFQFGSGTVFLTVGGSLTQSSNGIIVANALGLMVQGEAVLASNNVVNVFAADNGGLTVFNNEGDLTVGTVVFAPATPLAMSVSGITTFSGDAILDVAGGLIIQQTIDTGSNHVVLNADLAVEQSQSGPIFAASLGLHTGGKATLLANNQVDVLAADTGGMFLANNVTDLTIGTVTGAAGTPFEVTVSGVTTDGNDFKLTNSGRLSVEQMIDTATGSIFLDVAGPLTQTAQGAMVAQGAGIANSSQVLLDAANDFDVFAADTMGLLVLNDTDDLIIGTVVVAAGTASEISASGIRTSNNDAKLTTGGDLGITAAMELGTGNGLLNVSGSLSQTTDGVINAAGLGLLVDGPTVLVAANDVDEIAASGGTDVLMFRDVDDLSIGSVRVATGTTFEMMVSGIVSVNQDIKLVVDGDLVVQDAVSFASGTFFLDVSGDVSQLDSGTVSGSGLGFMIDGSLKWTADNDLEIVAGSSVGTFLLNDQDDLSIGTVTFAPGTPLEMSASGVTTADADAKLVVAGDLDLDQAVQTGNGSLILTTGGNVRQASAGMILADGLGLMVDGTTILDADNAIGTLALANNGLTIINNQSDLEIGSVTAFAESDFEMSLVGLIAADDLKMTVAGDLLIDEPVVTPQNIFLSVEGDVSQTIAGAVSADGLGLMVGGSTVLDANNQVRLIAGSFGQSLVFQNGNDLTVGSVAVAAGTPQEMSAIGITSTDGFLKLGVTGDLFLNQFVDATGNDVFLTATGDISQNDTGIITAGGLGLMNEGSTILAADNQIDVLAGHVSGLTVFNNVAELEIGAVTVAGGTGFEMSAVGLAAEGDIKLTVNGDLLIEQQIATDSNVLLMVSGQASQTDSGTISANGLALMVQGSTILAGANDVDVLAADNSGPLIFRDIDELATGTVTVAAGTPFEMTVVGISTAADDLKLAVAGDLNIAAAVDVGAANLFLTVGGNLSQTPSGFISATGLGLMVDGNTVLAEDNQISVFAADNQGFTILNATGNLTVGTVTVAGNSPFAMTATGVSTANDDVKLFVAGDLQIIRPVDLGQGNLLLNVDQNVLQSPSGTISAHGLALMVSGDSILNAANDVDVLAAAVTGFTVFNDIDNLTVGSVTVLAENPFEMTVAGIESQDDEVKVQTGGDLLIVEQIDVGSAGIFLTVGGDASQDSCGTIVAARLGTHVAGSMRLDANNDVHELATANVGFTLFNDIDDLVISRVTVAAGTAFEMSAVGVSTVDQDIKINCGGELLIDDPINSGNGNVLLSVGGPLSQTFVDPDGLDGTISCAGLGLMVSGPVDLSNPGNQIDRFAADVAGTVTFTAGSHLELASLTVDGMTIDCVDVLGDLELTIAGELTQSAAILVGGNAILDVSGNICLTGGGCDPDALAGNDNDFMGTLTAFAGSSLEIADSNELTIGNLVAADQIRLRSGDGSTGGLVLNGSITTTAAGGHVLLQSDLGVYQDAALSVIDTENLMLGSSVDSDARSGDFLLLGNNTVERIAAELEDGLEFANRRDLEIAPLDFVSQCGLFTAEFDGLHVDSLVVNITAGQATAGNLTDAANAVTVINGTAALNVIGDIVLGDGAASLDFTDHRIDQLLDQNVSTAYVSVAAAGNAGNPDGTDIASAASVSLYVDSTIILSDLNVSGLLFIDTIEGVSANGSAGHVLQTMIAEDTASSIQAETAVIVSNASIQLTNTVFVNVAVEANLQVGQLIMPFMINSQIGSTFTGSIDADVFTDPDAPPFVAGGTSGNPVDGVFDVEDAFLNDGFFSGNNAFINPGRVGAIIVNDHLLNVVSIDSLGLDANQLENIGNAGAAITSLGDVYLETRAASDLHISADITVTTAISNLTVISGDDLTLGDGAELRRMNATEVAGLVNTIQHGFAFDQFILNNPRSVIEAPGNIAFSDLNAQLDTAVGFQNFDFYFGNPGETSFNLIVGWFVNGVSASQAITPSFQASLLQEMSDLTGDFLLSDFGNFGQGISAYAIRLDNLTEGIDQPLSLTNISQFDQSFFAENPFWLSQIFLTNDARINLFADGGSTDLNFSQEVLPTQTVVQNPDFIVVDTPSFDVPVAPSNPPTPTVSFVNLIPIPEPTPLTIEPLPESYYVVKYTADDDGIFEDEFKWEDPNDDPDAIRAAIEDATLNDDDDFWPETEDEETGNWTDKIKKGQVKPGLYYIFEVQEGQELEEPVDVPVDRTDLENLVQPEADADISLFWKTETQYHDGEHTTVEPWTPWSASDDDRAMERWAPEPEEAGNMTVTTLAEADHHRLSDATRNASLGSSLLLAHCLWRNRQTGKPRYESEPAEPPASHDLFSRAARFRRQQQKRFG